MRAMTNKQTNRKQQLWRGLPRQKEMHGSGVGKKDTKRWRGTIFMTIFMRCLQIFMTF